MDRTSRVFVAGHRGLVGSAIVRTLEKAGHDNLILRPSRDLDLRDQLAVRSFFNETRPEYVFLAAAKVGGILANSQRPVDFLGDNLAIQTNVIESAYRSGARKLLFLGSSCIYPKFAPQPIKEEYLLEGELEPTNQWYAIAKIAGIRLAQAYFQQYGFRTISLMPTNLYGPGDNFDLQSSHVLPALMRKLHEAKLAGAPEVVVWGSGTPRREFLYVDDLAEAAVQMMQSYEDCMQILNVGTGEDLTIRELAEMIQEIVQFKGRLVFDVSKPDGTPRKQLDISRIESHGWRPRIPLRQGIEQTYSWYCEQHSLAR